MKIKLGSEFAELKMYYLLLEIFIISSIFIYDTQAYISISSPRPIRGENVTISCNTSSTVAFYNPQIQGTSLAICLTLSNSSSCIPSTFSSGEQTIYQFGTDGTISWVNILILNRTRDQTTWRCQDYGNASKAEAINLTVYTLPSAMKYVSPQPSSTDLGQTSLILECQTENCTYPEPQITWSYSNDFVYFITGNVTLSSNSSPCSQSEQIYTSTLRIQRGTVFPGNIPITKKLICGARYSLINSTYNSTPSQDVIFAVSLTFINISGPTNITNGTQVNFTCMTSGSRPPASVDWYVGNISVTTGIDNIIRSTADNMTYVESRLSFVAEDTRHHDKMIFCKAYTISATDVVTSEIRRLYVRVPVYSVSLSPADSMITATEGLEIRFECITSAGRPEPLIRWWLGGMMLFNVSSTQSIMNGTLVSTQSSLRLPMNKTHQNKTIYCDARVVDQPTVVESSKTVLNVLYPPSVPIVKPFSSSFPWLENRTERLECFASDRGNPSSSVIWNTSRVTVEANQQLIIENLGANDHGIQVRCQLQNYYTMVKNITLISEAISLSVEYTPIITLNPPNTSITVNETNKLNLTCSATGNPTPNSVSWVNQYPLSTVLYISDIRRNRAGIYTCAAESTSSSNIRLRMTKQVTVTVQYAPDISVRVVDLWPKERRISVECNAQGVPSSYAFNSWEHKFGNVVIRSGLQGTEADSTSVLNIYNASLEDMGTYVCSAANGIKGINGNLSQSNAAYLYVKGSPNIFTEQQYITGEVGQSVNISIQFYSDPSLSNITIKKNGILINATGRITRSMAFLNFTMYNKTVQLRIEMAHFITSALNKEDFGKYTLEFMNELGTREFIVDLKAPETTVDTQVGSIVGGVLGSVASLTVVAIVVFVLKRRGFQINHRKLISYIQSKLTKKSDYDSSTGNIEPEYVNTAINSTDEEKTYEDLRKHRSSDSPYFGLNADNSNGHKSSGSAIYANQQEHQYANVEVHTYSNIGHVNHDDKIYQNTST